MKICVPIREKNAKRFLAEFSKAENVADVIEIWFDEVKTSPELLSRIQKSKKPILYKVTSPNPNLEIKADYIDFDLNSKPIAHKKLIISYHNFDETPSDKELEKIIKKMSKHKPYIYKIATKAKDFSDSLRMLKLLNTLTLTGKRAICICMGKEGKITRAAGHLFGNYLMFAPLDEKNASAPGQLTLKDLRKIHNLL